MTIICQDFRSRSSSKLLLSLIVSIISGTKGDQTFLNSEEHLLRQLRITTRKLCLSSRLHCFNNELFLLQVWWGKGFIYAYFGYRVGFSLLFFQCGSKMSICVRFQLHWNPIVWLILITYMGRALMQIRQPSFRVYENKLQVLQSR